MRRSTTCSKSSSELDLHPDLDYCRYFGFSQAPFGRAAARLDDERQRALERALDALDARCGVVVLSGAPGTGKTLLLQRLHAALDARPQHRPLRPALPPRERSGWLEGLEDDLGDDPPGGRRDGDAALQATATRLRQRRFATVLLVDEAQRLAPVTLAELMLLARWVGHHHLQLVLSTTDPPGALLSRAGLLADGALSIHLTPLTRQRMRHYVLDRLQRARDPTRPAEQLPPPPRFSAPALYRLYRFSAGIPRQIDALADRALLAARLTRRRRIGVALIDEAAAALLLPPPRCAAPRPTLIAAITLGVCLLGVWRDTAEIDPRARALAQADLLLDGYQRLRRHLPFGGER